MRPAQRVPLLLALLVACNGGGDSTAPPEPEPEPDPVTTTLSCEDPDDPGGFVGCTLTLEESAGIKLVLTSSNCEVSGNAVRITQPEPATLTEDGCNEAPGKELLLEGPYEPGTEVAIEVVSPELENPPQLRVSGEYPEWTLNFEDGVDDDFDDLVFTLTALPAS